MLHTAYPANDLIGFYSKHFRALGFVPASKAGFGEWSKFIESENETPLTVRQFIALWINRNSRRQVVLVLRYLCPPGTVSTDIANVSLEIQPYADSTKLDAFLRQLETEGTYASFFERLDRYRTEDGKLDLDRAVREHPDDRRLQEYKRLVNEAQK
jgi:hypothetical protein